MNPYNSILKLQKYPYCYRFCFLSIKEKNPKNSL